MANIVPDSFKTDTLKGTFNFKSTAQGGGSTFKLALYDDISAFSTATTAYTTTNEVSSSGTNYTAGGNTLTNFGVNISSNIAYVDFDDLTFSSVTLQLTVISLFSFQLLIRLMQSLDLATRNIYKEYKWR
jgi:beta-glucanase (GH16 family)